MINKEINTAATPVSHYKNLVSINSGGYYLCNVYNPLNNEPITAYIHITSGTHGRGRNNEYHAILIAHSIIPPFKVGIIKRNENNNRFSFNVLELQKGKTDSVKFGEVEIINTATVAEVFEAISNKGVKKKTSTQVVELIIPINPNQKEFLGKIMVGKVVKGFCLDNEGNRSLQELEVVTILSSTVDFKVNMNGKDCLLSFYSSGGFFELKIPEVDRVLKYRFNIETIEEKDDDGDWSEL